MTTQKTARDPYPTTYHRDGTVTIWHVYQQQWMRIPAGDVSDETLATLTDRERQRISRIAARHDA